MLVLVPWSAFWDRNYFGEVLPTLKAVLTNNYVRGAVMGLGLVNVWAAISDLAEIIRGRTGNDTGL